jgi:hypothetical protein
LASLKSSIGARQAKGVRLGRASSGAEDAAHGADLVEGAKAVQLADLAYRSVAAGRWMTVPEITL